MQLWGVLDFDMRELFVLKTRLVVINLCNLTIGSLIMNAEC